MDLFAPEYASRFRCIADKCKNSCCVGWEIGIDEKTRKLYKQLDGRLGEKMAACLSEDQDGAVIRLGCDGRCPFLDSRGLCDIIKEKGEEWLSEICREHPRYYNLLSSRAEWGIGLACEAAATLILECDDIRRTVKGEYPSEAIEDETEAFVLGVR
jgi:lysine-N-methylase